MLADVSPPEILSLVADPQRWQLLAELSRSDRRVGELTALLDKPQNLVSYHLAELRRAGLVGARRSSADRRDVYYRADLRRCRELLAAASGALHPAMRLEVAAPRRPRRASRPPRVLFLCTGNSARSQIAEALVTARSEGAVHARSAGSHPKPVHPNAVRVMAARGLDISDRSSKHLRRFERTKFDRVVTLCDRVREVCPEFPGAATAHWSIADPAADGAPDTDTYPAFELVTGELDERIEVLVTELLDNPTKGTNNVR